MATESTSYSSTVSPGLGKAPRATPTVIAEAVGAFELGPRDVHPWHKPAQPSHDAMRASPHHPVFVTPNPMAGTQVSARPRLREQLAQRQLLCAHARARCFSCGGSQQAPPPSAHSRTFTRPAPPQHTQPSNTADV